MQRVEQKHMKQSFQSLFHHQTKKKSLVREDELHSYIMPKSDHQVTSNLQKANINNRFE